MKEPSGLLQVGLKEALRRGYLLSLAMLAATGTAALLLDTLSGKVSPAAAMEALRFFCFFSVQNAVAVASWSSVRALRRRSETNGAEPKGFSGPGVQLALTASSLLTAGGYYALLDGQWRPDGLSAFGSLILHAVVPAMIVLDWIFFARKGAVRPIAILGALLLPLFHLAAALSLGMATGWYPYGFLDPIALGASAFLRNVAVFAGLFLLAGLLLFLVDRAMRRRIRREAG